MSSVQLQESQESYVLSYDCRVCVVFVVECGAGVDEELEYLFVSRLLFTYLR